MLRAHKDSHDSRASIARLWVHECFRVFSDRLVDVRDAEAFTGLLSEQLAATFDLTYHNLCPSRQPPIFGDFMRDGVYEDITDFQALRVFMEQQLEDYNRSPGALPMSLTLFRDAIEHVTRIVRVIRQPRGNMLLVGIGGSGRQCLVRLAAFLCRHCVFHIEVTRHYRRQEFRDDLKRLYWQAGVENRRTVFIAGRHADPPRRGFLEDVNNILSSGEVPASTRPRSSSRCERR
ncbi:dynein axonemal heavy chain 2-like [Lampetra fluviatilis]